MIGAHRLHPLTWWVWAAGLGVAASRTTNPLLLLLVFAIVALVVSLRRTNAAWADTLHVAVRLALLVVGLRIVLQIVFGNRYGGHTLFSLPRVPLPSWAAGVSIGGPVTSEALLYSLYHGLQLAVILVCFAAANSLTSPYRLLRCLPAVLYEAGVALTVALTFTPGAVLTIRQVRAARRLRGRATRGLAGLRGMAVPVLEGALDQALELAASMDARAYGRTRDRGTTSARLADGAACLGVLLAAVGAFGTLDQAGTIGTIGPALLAMGIATLGCSLIARSRRTTRTRYRPDRWQGPEWVISGGAVAVVAGFVAWPAALASSTTPPRWPSLPVAPAVALALTLVPALMVTRSAASGVVPPRRALDAGDRADGGSAVPA